MLVVAMFGGFLLIVMVALLQRFFLSRIAVRIDRASLDMLSEKLLALPMSYFNSRRTGDIARRLNGMRQVRQFIVQHGVGGLAAATQIRVAVAIMFAFSWRLTLVYLITVPLYAVMMWFSQTRLRPTYDVLEEVLGQVSVPPDRLHRGHRDRQGDGRGGPAAAAAAGPVQRAVRTGSIGRI